MKIPSKKRPHLSKYAGINPNMLLKKRNAFTSNDDRKRDLDCKNQFLTFYKYIKHIFLAMVGSEYSSSRNQRYSILKTHVLSDEISLIPPVCRSILFLYIKILLLSLDLSKSGY